MRTELRSGTWSRNRSKCSSPARVGRGFLSLWGGISPEEWRRCRPGARPADGWKWRPSKRIAPTIAKRPTRGCAAAVGVRTAIYADSRARSRLPRDIGAKQPQFSTTVSDFPLTWGRVDDIIPLADIETLSTGRSVCVLISLGVPGWHSLRLATHVTAAHSQPQIHFPPGVVTHQEILTDGTDIQT